jgi:hypothetical protein
MQLAPLQHGILGITVVFAPVVQVVLGVMREDKDGAGSPVGMRR